MSIQLTDRERVVVDMRDGGATWRVVGDRLGVSLERGRQIYHVAQKKLSNGASRTDAEDEDDISRLALSPRTCNILRRYGFGTISLLAETPYSTLAGLSMIGAGTIDEIKQALALHKGQVQGDEALARWAAEQLPWFQRQLMASWRDAFEVGRRSALSRKESDDHE